MKYRAPSGANNDKNGNKGTLHASRQAIVVHGNRKKAKDKCTHIKIYFIASLFSIYKTRSLGALHAPTFSWRPFGHLDFILRALWALRPYD